jgi:DNA repair exonuclease SbcCD ATPase subunit
VSSVIDEIQRRIEELDAFEAEWSTGSRKARRAALQRDLYAQTEAQLRAEQQLQSELAGSEATLNGLYEDLISKMIEVNNAAEAIQDARPENYALWNRARAVGLRGLPGRVPKLSVRTMTDRSLLAELHRLRAWSGSDI